MTSRLSEKKLADPVTTCYFNIELSIYNTVLTCVHVYCLMLVTLVLTPCILRLKASTKLQFPISAKGLCRWDRGVAWLGD